MSNFMSYLFPSIKTEESKAQIVMNLNGAQKKIATTEVIIE